MDSIARWTPVDRRPCGFVRLVLTVTPPTVTVTANGTTILTATLEGFRFLKPRTEYGISYSDDPDAAAMTMDNVVIDFH